MHRGDEELVVGAEADSEMRSRPFQPFRRRRHVGKPQRHAVVMRDRQPQSFRRESQTADSGFHLVRLLLALGGADERRLAHRPRHRAIAVQRNVVDPAVLGIGRQRGDVAVPRDLHQLAVVAAGDDALAVRCHAKHGAIVDRQPRRLAFACGESHGFFGANEGRDVAEEMNSGNRAADLHRQHTICNRSNRGRIFRQSKRTHHVVTHCSKPSRIACSGNSRPMNTSRLSRGSPSFQAR